MKKILSSLLLIFLFATSYPQILKPVKWTFETENLGNGDYNLIFKASIDDGWYLYSQFIEEGGPVPTTFYFEEVTKATKIGKTKIQFNNKKCLA